MYFFTEFDLTYLLFMLPCIAFALWANYNVKSTFDKYSQQLSQKNITGADAAKRVLSAHGITDVKIEWALGKLEDHYDPKTKTIRLSEEVYSSTSTAAIGVACHEAGHAVQYAQNYFPVKIRTAIIPVTNIGSNIGIPLIMLGLLLEYFVKVSDFFIYLGIACYSLSLILQLITLPVEFNASRNAIFAIANYGILTYEEQIGAKRTLRAAALTYVATTAISLVQFLRVLALVTGRKRRD